jgi:hypothetical protein
MNQNTECSLKRWNEISASLEHFAQKYCMHLAKEIRV